MKRKIDELPRIGLLKYLGYEVGQSGISQPDRLNILTKAFKMELPQIEEEEYMEQWGEPNSAKRLSKIAFSLYHFTEYAKKRKNPPLVAIEHWEEDLESLKIKFYDGRFSFQWPGTPIKLD